MSMLGAQEIEMSVQFATLRAHNLAVVLINFIFKLDIFYANKINKKLNVS